jgi:SAM-dependent methyltransferase
MSPNDSTLTLRKQPGITRVSQTRSSPQIGLSYTTPLTHPEAARARETPTSPTTMTHSKPALPSRSTTPEALAELFRGRAWPEDHVFDQFLPDAPRAVSEQYWTPLAVIRRATEWLDELDVRSVLDIGSGAGKFCVAAALGGRSDFTGLEQRPHLVEAARTLARTFGVTDRACFIEGTFGELPLPHVEAYYLYNPFDELAFAAESRLDHDVDISHARRQRDIAAVQKLLREARAGTYILTYSGFGGNLPPGYRELRVDRGFPQVLRLSRKMGSAARRSSSGSHSKSQTSPA